MKKYLKYLPYALIVVALLVGRLSAPVHDKDLIRKFELERKTLKEDIKDKETQITDLTNAGLTIAKRMKEDSLKTSVQLQANKRAFLELKKRYEKINLSNATTSELDSIRAGIIALYPIK